MYVHGGTNDTGCLARHASCGDDEIGDFWLGPSVRGILLLMWLLGLASGVGQSKGPLKIMILVCIPFNDSQFKMGEAWALGHWERSLVAAGSSRALMRICWKLTEKRS